MFIALFFMHFYKYVQRMYVLFIIDNVFKLFLADYCLQVGLGRISGIAGYPAGYPVIFFFLYLTIKIPINKQTKA